MPPASPSPADLLPITAANILPARGPNQSSCHEMDSSNSPIEKVLIITADSRTLVGKLLSCDQMTNLVRPGLSYPLTPYPPNLPPPDPRSPFILACLLACLPTL